MMSRCLIHKSKLDQFKQFLTERGTEHRAGKGDYQVLQVRWNGQWMCLYDRHVAPEHYTSDMRLDYLVREFIKAGRRIA